MNQMMHTFHVTGSHDSHGVVECCRVVTSLLILPSALTNTMQKVSLRVNIHMVNKFSESQGVVMGGAWFYFE